jgi:hypothetical protein
MSNKDTKAKTGTAAILKPKKRTGFAGGRISTSRERGFQPKNHGYEAVTKITRLRPPQSLATYVWRTPDTVPAVCLDPETNEHVTLASLGQTSTAK